MMLYSLNLPDSHADLGPFLEQSLAGQHLTDLVDELRAVSGPTTKLTLDEVLAADRRRVLESGLACLTFDRQRQLLANPGLLLELQELVHMAGGPYWIELLHDADAQAAAERDWKVVDPQLVRSEAPLVRGVPSQSLSRRWSVVAIIAAAVLVAGYLNRPVARAWGWSRPGVFEVAMERRPYLEHLAEIAGEWFAAEPRNAAELATRLKQFRDGCDKLIAAPHASLPHTDREWLIERCKVWTAKIDAALASLDRNQRSMERVKADMKTTVNQLTDALRLRASQSLTADSGGTA